MKYGLSEKQLKEITGIFSEFPEIEKTILFGSRAMSTYKEASDVDLVLMGNDVDIALAAKVKDQLEEESYLPFFFDVLSYNSIQSEDLKQHIQNKGVLLYQKE